MRQHFFVGGVIMSILGCQSTNAIRAGMQGQASAINADTRAVIDLLDQDYQARLQANPFWASMQGERDYDDKLPDISKFAIQRRLEEAKVRLALAHDINRTNLSSEMNLNLDLLIWELEKQIDLSAYFPEQLVVNQLWGPHISLPQLPDRITFETDKHLSDYVARLSGIPRFLTQLTENLRDGLLVGRTPPKSVMQSVPHQVLDQVGENVFNNPALHPLYKPFLNMGSDEPLPLKARGILLSDVLPALRQFGKFLRDEYVPNCRDTIAAREFPNGASYYDLRLSHFTTLNLGAKEIYEEGLKEVDRIKKEMMKVIYRSDFVRPSELKGDELFAAFVKYLREDKRFYYESPDTMLRDYGYIAKQIDGVLPKLFGKLPRLSYGLRAMPSFMAENAPMAYYYPGSSKNGVSGTFVVNTAQLDQRPKFEMRALTFHEAVPGHHLQISLADELADAGLHKWRMLLSYTVFVEGWALYAERLGLEFGPDHERGFYADPYDDFGRLSYEMWRALRLVVDPGIHAFGWTREQAIEYMLRNSSLTLKNVENEVDRYIVWPGQAVAYKIGELRIRELRSQAQAALGSDFDLRAFHDLVLGAGSIPLSVLSRRVKEWTEYQKK